MPDIWCIYHVNNCPYTVPVKDKFVIIVCFDGHPLGFFINSKVHSFAQNRPALLRCQILLKSSEFWFLHHDSYIDCSKLHEFDEELLNNGREIVSKKIQQEIKTAITESALIEKYYQELILSN